MITKELISSTLEKEPAVFLYLQSLWDTPHGSIRDHRASIDWAEDTKYLADVMYPDMKKNVLVMTILNTHKPVSLYKKYPPAEARKIIRRLVQQILFVQLRKYVSDGFSLFA